ncbi:MAG TPA: hypothetical protein VEL71_05015 [Candidatus Dormibacteraeota bacterium]|nr:hypothetical protein [Candidatus Dormibacteraeota bacterium]
MGFEIPTLIGGLIVGALLVYLLLAQRANQQARTLYNEWITTGKMRIEKEADQKAEQKYNQISMANLKAWEATGLQQVKDEERKSAEERKQNSLDTSRVVLKGKSQNKWLLYCQSSETSTTLLMRDLSEAPLTISSSRI